MPAAETGTTDSDMKKSLAARFRTEENVFGLAFDAPPSAPISAYLAGSDEIAHSILTAP
jgi:hypothetical protein